MAKLAIEYVKALKRGKIALPELDPKHPLYGKPLTPAEWRVLEPLAALHNEYVWCAWPEKYTIACMANMSQSYVDKQILRLIERGILRRYFVTSERWGEQTSNEYEFVALGEHEVSQQERDMIFKYKRVRSAIQLSLRRGGRQRKASTADAGSTPGEQSKQGSNEQVQQQAAADVELDGPGQNDGPGDVALDDARGDLPPPAVEMGVEKAVDEIAGDNLRDCEGQSRGLPVELFRSLHCDLSSPLPPPLAPESVEKLPIMAKARATASARATATTSSTEAARAAMERGGAAGMRSARGASLGAGEPEIERGLEGFDEATRHAVRWLLTECGISPVTATRSLRKTVGEALLMEIERTGCSLVEAAAKALVSWREYAEMSWALHHRVELRRFMREGLWLDQSRWNWDKQAIREQRRSY